VIAILKNIFKVAILTIIWLVLRASVSPMDIFFGVAVSLLCVWYSQKFIPIGAITGVKFYKLIPYIFYLIGQIYVSGFYVIKMILTGATTYTVSVKTTIQNETLRVILGDSITLTPGSTLLDIADDKITVVLLCSKKDAAPLENADKKIKGNLENWLLKIEQGKPV